MKFKPLELVTAYRALAALSKQKIPARASYWVSRLIIKLEPEYIAIENKRVELIKKHGVMDEKGNFKVGPEKLEAFSAEFDPITKDEIEVAVEPINIAVFGDANIAPADFVALDKLLVQEASE